MTRSLLTFGVISFVCPASRHLSHRAGIGVSVDWTFTVGMRFLLYYDPKIVAESETGSSDIPGHDGRTDIAATTCQSTCGIGLMRTVQSYGDNGA